MIADHKFIISCKDNELLKLIDDICRQDAQLTKLPLDTKNMAVIFVLNYPEDIAI